MTEIVVAQRMWQRRGTTAQWATANPVLNQGEIGFEYDNVDPEMLIGMKTGNGVNAWLDLLYTAVGRSDLTGITDGDVMAWDSAAKTWLPTSPSLSPDTAVVIPIVSGVATMDCALGRLFTLALTANATLAFANPPAADCMILQVTVTAGAVLSLPGSVTAADGSTYTTRGTSGKEVLGFLTLNTGTAYNLTKQQP